jgi:hypothetical protein
VSWSYRLIFICYWYNGVKELWRNGKQEGIGRNVIRSHRPLPESCGTFLSSHVETSCQVAVPTPQDSANQFLCGCLHRVASSNCSLTRFLTASPQKTIDMNCSESKCQGEAPTVDRNYEIVLSGRACLTPQEYAEFEECWSAGENRRSLWQKPDPALFCTQKSNTDCPRAE